MQLPLPEVGSGPGEQPCPSLWAQNLPQEQSPEVHVSPGEEGTEISLLWLCVWASEHNLASHPLIIHFFFFPNLLKNLQPHNSK